MSAKTEAHIHTTKSLIENNAFLSIELASMLMRFIDIVNSINDELDDLKNEIGRVGVEDEY